MLHAGWRGLADGVIAAGVAGAARPRRRARSRPRSAPGAGPCCYEVGDEVHAAFADEPGGTRRPQGARPRAARGGGRRRGPRLRAVHDPRRALLLPPPRPRRHRPPGGGRVAELIRGIDAGVVRANLDRVRERDRRHRARPGRGRDPRRGQVRRARGARRRSPRPGSRVVGENRAQDLEAKAQAHPRAAPGTSSATCRAARSSRCCRSCATIHSVASDSVARASSSATPRRRREVLVEVNVAGEAGKSGVAPGELDDVPRALPGRASSGLMTMPPLADRPRGQPPLVRRAGASSPGEHGLRELSMGTIAGLRGRRPGGRDDRAARHDPVPLNSGG